MHEDFDVAVVGSGPAGYALAYACAKRKLRVVVVDPNVSAENISTSPHWPNTFAMWRHEITQLGLTFCTANTWAQTSFVATGVAHSLDAGYSLIDNDKLARHLRASTPESPKFINAKLSLENFSQIEPDKVQINLGDRELRCAVVVDATNGSLDANKFQPKYFQRAFGIIAKFDVAPIAPDSAMLMDWTDANGASNPTTPPSFLYGFDLSTPTDDNVFFVEETVLATADYISDAELENRLLNRLNRNNTLPIDIRRTESVTIALDRPIPQRPKLINWRTTHDAKPAFMLARFGASAAFVNPISGYSLSTALRLAPTVAAHIADAIQRPIAGVATTHQLVDAITHAAWPFDARRRRSIEMYGMHVLASLDQHGAQEFFNTFFALSRPNWQAFLCGTSSTALTAKMMTRMFQHAPNRTRKNLIKPSFRLFSQGVAK